MDQQYQPCPCGSAFQTTGLVCPACEGREQPYRVVRHPNGHLMVEHCPLPTPEEFDAAFASIAKVWPYLAEHAPHIDGEFGNALSRLRRMAERLLNALNDGPQSDPGKPSGADALLAEFVGDWEETITEVYSEAGPRDAAQLDIAALLYLKAKRYLAPDPRDAPNGVA